MLFPAMVRPTCTSLTKMTIVNGKFWKCNESKGNRWKEVEVESNKWKREELEATHVASWKKMEAVYVTMEDMLFGSCHVI